MTSNHELKGLTVHIVYYVEYAHRLTYGNFFVSFRI